MRYAKLAALCLTLALLAASPANAQDPTGLGANAALKYWPAFALMPPLDIHQETLLDRWNKVPLDAAAVRLIAESEDSRLYLHRGAKLPRCDWSLDYDDGPKLLLPYLARARDLARLTALHARHEFELGNAKAGADDTIAIFALARHTGSEPIMIGILVRYLIESIAVDLAAAYLPEMPDVAPAIVSAYEALPPGATLSQAYSGMEKQHTVVWLARKLKEAEARKKGAWREVWKSAFPGKNLDVVDHVESFEEAVAQTEALIPLCETYARLAALPHDEFAAQFPRRKAEPPLASWLLTTPALARARKDQNDVRLAMLKAAIAVVRGGPETLKGTKDPFGDGPFTYRALDPGFELRSALLDHEKPVTLTVGRPKVR